MIRHHIASWSTHLSTYYVLCFIHQIRIILWRKIWDMYQVVGICTNIMLIKLNGKQKTHRSNPNHFVLMQDITEIREFSNFPFGFISFNLLHLLLITSPYWIHSFEAITRKSYKMCLQIKFLWKFELVLKFFSTFCADWWLEMRKFSLPQLKEQLIDRSTENSYSINTSIAIQARKRKIAFVFPLDFPSALNRANQAKVFAL